MNNASFLLIKTNKDAKGVLNSLRESELVKWSSIVYGPHQIVAYLEGASENELVEYSENLRSADGISEVDARLVKIIPKDEDLGEITITQPKVAVLLINVNHKEEKERVVTWNLRDLDGIIWARAMWGPTDIIAIVEEADRESMRNKICDEVKTMKGVMTNSTYYCYPQQ